MHAIKTKTTNLVFEHKQSGAKLPAKVVGEKATVCYYMTFFDRVIALFSGRIYVTIQIGKGPIQPQTLSVNEP